ncbi:acyltransferase family protein [Glutamicibacter ardleyensis]|uniref:acyltransferase family protein n=1 Tax=Glutamicibacter ardleyensis TaxID=225894 RepID=UPI003FD261F2
MSVTLEYSSPSKPENHPKKRENGFRGDIQGLRAIAVGLVVLYHFWPNRLPGGFIGVDIFFVISGFLITSHLISKPPRRLADVGTFWMRRVKRLLPASFLVIFVSVLGIWAFAPKTVWQDWGLQAIAATFYFQNWFLAINKVDYMAEADAPSPFQHFWSLSVEEQFYFFWPIAIGLLVLVAQLKRLSVKNVALTAVGAVFVLSLAFSIYQTEADSGVSYFSTFTRMWEFAAGALVACLGVRIYAAKTDLVSLIAAWGGLFALLFSAFTFQGEMAFPGYIALLPVLGTALIILANSQHRYSPSRLLRLKFVRFVGDTSYAIYLWHWPLLILIPYIVSDFKWPQKILALALTLAISVLTQKLVELKFRNFITTSHLLSAPRFLVAGSLVVAIVSGSFYVVSTSRIEQARDIQGSMNQVIDAVGAECFGANALKNDCESKDLRADTYETVVPAPVVAKDDQPDVYEDNCFSNQGTDFQERPVCTYGDGPTKVALVGNSHAGHWLPTLQKLAEENDWTIDTYVATRCAVMGEAQEFDAKAEVKGCADLGDWVTSEIDKNDYELVISSNRQSRPVVGFDLDSSTAPAEKAYGELLSDWADTGTKVAVLRDTPWPGYTMDSIPDCIAENPDAVKKCSGNKDKWIPVDPQAKAVDALDNPNIVKVDMNDQFCDDKTCYGVVGGIVAYWDHSHMTATYAESLSDTLAQRLNKKLGANDIFSG